MMGRSSTFLRCLRKQRHPGIWIVLAGIDRLLQTIDTAAMKFLGLVLVISSM